MSKPVFRTVLALVVGMQLVMAAPVRAQTPPATTETAPPADPNAAPAEPATPTDPNAPPPLTVDPNAPSATAEAQTAAEAQPAPAPVAPVVAPAPEKGWGWLSVAGWASLAVGTIGVVIGAVTLANPQDFYAVTADRRITPNSVFGFGALVAGAALAIVGGVLLYLDTALN